MTQELLFFNNVLMGLRLLKQKRVMVSVQTPLLTAYFYGYVTERQNTDKDWGQTASADSFGREKGPRNIPKDTLWNFEILIQVLAC